LVAVLISRPKLVLLDEPFSGLDPVNAVVLRDAILRLRDSGTTVLFSTHDMATAERMCDSIVMIFNGRKVLDGPLETIRRTYGADTIRVRMSGARVPADLAVGMTDFGQYQELRVTPDTDPQQVLRRLTEIGRVELFELAHTELAGHLRPHRRPRTGRRGTRHGGGDRVSKTLVIAVREYFATVRTKGFIAGVILMPFLMAGGAVIQQLTQNLVDADVHKVAVLDRTPGQSLARLLVEASKEASEAPVPRAPKTQTTPARAAFAIEVVESTGDIDATRLAMSQRVRDGELFATVEIAPRALAASTRPASTGPALMRADPEALIYYSSNRPTFVELRDFVEEALEQHVVAARLGRPQEEVKAVTDLLGTLVVPRGLASREESGRVTFEPRKNELVLAALPVRDGDADADRRARRRQPTDDKHHRGKTAPHRRGAARQCLAVRAHARQAARRRRHVAHARGDLRRRGHVPRLAGGRAAPAHARDHRLVRGLRRRRRADVRRDVRRRRRGGDEHQRGSGAGHADDAHRRHANVPRRPDSQQPARHGGEDRHVLPA
jgi:hypothetical protein